MRHISPRAQHLMRLAAVVAVLWTGASILYAQNGEEVPPPQPPPAPEVVGLQLEVPPRVVGEVSYTVKVTALGADGEPLDRDHGAVVLSSEDVTVIVPPDTKYEWKNGALEIEDVVVRGKRFFQIGNVDLRADMGAASATIQSRYIPGPATLLPSLLAIILALVTREVLLSLFLGTWLGATVIGGGNPAEGFGSSMGYLVKALADNDHASVILFTLMIGGMIALINRTGGTGGLVAALRRIARTPRSGQISTWLMGMAVFFDDYASLLLTGSTMRAITDRLRISREKLSFIVDATAAPVANIAIISTWVGYELSLINEGFAPYAETTGKVNALTVFVASIPYRFYPLLMLVFIIIIAVSLRDFGPMYTAEMRTRRSGRVLRKGATPAATPDGAVVLGPGAKPQWWNAVIPIVVMTAAVAIGLFADGLSSLRETALANPAAPQGPFRLHEIFGEANSFRVLMISSFLGAGSAVILAVGQRILSFRETVRTWGEGAKGITPALIILVLAWSLAAVTADLQAAGYLRTFVEGNAVNWIPLVVFVIAAFVSFATGTAWGTMALLTPLTIQLVADTMGPDPGTPIMLAAVGAVLGGATVGDHVSPISDTTIMSSMSCGADLVDHVRTQLPYAAVVAGVAIVFGYVAVALEVPVGLSLLGGIVGLGVVVVLIGKRTDSAAVLGAIRADLTSGEREQRISALDELAGMAGSPLATEVVRLLADSDDQVRIQALRALGRMKHSAARAAVERELDSDNRHIRATAVKALSQLGGSNVLPQLIDRIHDEDPRVRANAVEAISHVEGQLADEAVKALTAATTDEDHRVRATAAMVLWKRTRDDSHLEHLITMIRTGTKKAALSAIYALSEVDGNFAVRILREAVAGTDPEVTTAAVRALERFDVKEDTTPGEIPPPISEDGI